MDLSRLHMKFEFEWYSEYYYEIDLGGQFAIYATISLAEGLIQISTIQFLKKRNERNSYLAIRQD